MKEIFFDDNDRQIKEGDTLIYNTWMPTSGPDYGRGVVEVSEYGVWSVKDGMCHERLHDLANCLLIEDEVTCEQAKKLLEPGVLKYWYSGRARHRILT